MSTVPHFLRTFSQSYIKKRYNSSFSMPAQKAVVHKSEGVSELRSDVPLPKLPANNWVLVKTKAVALNPTDWKNIARAASPGAIAGCDYAGIVEETGKDVTDLKVGDRIAGFVRGGKVNISVKGISR